MFTSLKNLTPTKVEIRSPLLDVSDRIAYRDKLDRVCKTNLQNLDTFICVKDASRWIQYGFGIRWEVEHWELRSEFLIGLNEFEWCSLPRQNVAVVCETGRATPFNIHYTAFSTQRKISLNPSCTSKASSLSTICLQFILKFIFLHCIRNANFMKDRRGFFF